MYVPRQRDSLQHYLEEVSRIPPLTPDEEVQLARRIKQGCQEALHTLTCANLRFVVSVARKYRWQGLSLADLIEEGNYGLIKAAHGFDETRGFKFITYAVWWVRHAILHALAKRSRVVRLPLSSVRMITRLHKARARLVQLHERAPNPEELAEKLDIDIEKVREALLHTGHSLSMEAPFTGDSEQCLLDVLPGGETSAPDTWLLVESVRLDIERALRALAPREAEILRLYFGIRCERPQRLGEIGQRFGLSGEGVRRIKEKALCKLRRTLLPPDTGPGSA